MVVFGVDVILFGFIGLFAGGHCIGMCGPLVTVYAEAMQGDDGVRADGMGHRRGRGVLTVFQVRQHALFNLGRAASYTVIGGIMGGVGGLVFTSMGQIMGPLTQVRGVTGIVLGAAIIGQGLYYTSGRIGLDIRIPGVSALLRRVHAHVNRWANGPGILGLGAMHGLLPCPILYPAYAFAFATGSAIAGATALAALGIGTIPTVFLYGTVISEVDVRHRRRLHRGLGIVFVVLGYVLLAHGLASIGVHVPHPRLPFWDPLASPAIGPGH